MQQMNISPDINQFRAIKILRIGRWIQ